MPRSDKLGPQYKERMRLLSSIYEQATQSAIHRTESAFIKELKDAFGTRPEGCTYTREGFKMWATSDFGKRSIKKARNSALKKTKELLATDLKTNQQLQEFKRDHKLMDMYKKTVIDTGKGIVGLATGVTVVLVCGASGAFVGGAVGLAAGFAIGALANAILVPLTGGLARLFRL